MSIIGGEPTLHPQLLLEAVEDASEFGFHVSVVSNGFGLNEDLLVRLKDAGMERLGLSVDTEEVSARIDREKAYRLLGVAKSLGIIPTVNTVFTRNSDITTFKQFAEEVIDQGFFFNFLVCNPAVSGGAFSGAPPELVPTKGQIMEIVPWLMWKKVTTGFVENPLVNLYTFMHLSSQSQPPSSLPPGVIFQDIIDTR